MEGEPVQRIACGTVVRCLGVMPSSGESEKPAPDERFRTESAAIFADFEDCRTREVYKYQWSLRPLRPWEGAESP